MAVAERRCTRRSLNLLEGSAFCFLVSCEYIPELDINYRPAESVQQNSLRPAYTTREANTSHGTS